MCVCACMCVRWSNSFYKMAADGHVLIEIFLNLEGDGFGISLLCLSALEHHPEPSEKLYVRLSVHLNKKHNQYILNTVNVNTVLTLQIEVLHTDATYCPKTVSTWR